MELVRLAGDAYAPRVDEHKRDGPSLRIHGAARTMAQLRQPLQPDRPARASEALKAAWKTRKTPADDLWRRARARLGVCVLTSRLFLDE